MSSVTLTLHRVYTPGRISFEVPTAPAAQAALVQVLRKCQDKANDFVSVTFETPKKPRSTGAHSQNHHLNAHCMQMANETGNDFETIKYCVKMIAVEQLGYPYTDVNGHVVPKRERDTSTEECSLLIEAAHLLAADLHMVLKEE